MKHQLLFICLAFMLLPFVAKAQEANNEFSIDAKMVSRGEVRVGGFENDDDNPNLHSQFILGQYQISLDYKRSDWLELKLTPKMSGVWGQATSNLNLFEAWASMTSKKGWFTKIGRQLLEYDDERILGYDDWTMTAPTHDVVKFGYEGYNHKIHAILAYNQNAENMMTGNDYYSDGIQPYKTMQTLWYHYDTPRNLFGVSLIGMNIGMQNANTTTPATYFQQLIGTYLELNTGMVTAEGSFYYQMGKEEHGVPIDAFMFSGRVIVKPNEFFDVFTGYDYLSGDKYFCVPASPSSHILPGVIQHDTIRGFCPIFGSHHQFYGAMEFFYMDSYVGGFTPGLQNLYVGTTINPIQGLEASIAYHYYAIATDLSPLKKTLGHEIEIEGEYAFGKFIKIGAGYTYMRGSETMDILQRLPENRRLHWGWLMLSINPTLFTTSWRDK